MFVNSEITSVYTAYQNRLNCITISIVNLAGGTYFVTCIMFCEIRHYMIYKLLSPTFITLGDIWVIIQDRKFLLKTHYVDFCIIIRKIYFN